MKLKISCPVCHQKLRIPLTLKQLKVKCPSCSNSFVFGFKIVESFKNFFKLKKTKFFDGGGYTNLEYTKKISRVFYGLIIFLMVLFILNYFLKVTAIEKLKKQYYQQIKQKYEKNIPKNKKEI